MYDNSLFYYMLNDFEYNRSLLIEPIPDLSSQFEGILYMSIGVVSIILYIPSFFAIIDKNNYKLPAYKIMAQMAVFDILNLFIFGGLAGIQSIMGLNYWNSPFLSVFICESGHVFWCIMNGDLIVLAIQRCIQIISPNLAGDLFAGSKSYIWLMTPILITIAMIIVCPIFTYTPVFNICVSDPFLGYPNNSTRKFENIYQTVENFGNSLFVVSVYIIFFIIFIIKKKETETNVKKSSVKDSQSIILFIQTASICFVTLSSNLLYTVESYIQLPLFAFTLTHVATLLVHSFPPLIYLMVNKTLKNTLKGYFKNDKTSVAAEKGKSISIRSPVPVKVI